MSTLWTAPINRRDFLKMNAVAGAAGTGLLALPSQAQSAPVNFQTWSAGVDTVKSHLTGFEATTGLKVNYSNSPYAQYRDSMVTKFVGKAPMDVMWVSDTWLPEWAEAGWLAPVNGYPELMKYNADVDDFCNKSLQYKGKQYGLTYYSDYMAFFYDADKLKRAGIKEPPTTWDELIQQSLKIKSAGISEYPLMLSMARESWLIEFLTAMVFSHGGRFADDNGEPLMNDPKQSAIAGNVKQALMPAGTGGSHATVGWMRFYGLSAQAAADKARAANAVKLIEWFGGKANGKYQFQKMMFTDIGSGFGVKQLFKDSDVRGAYEKYADIVMYEKQQQLARKKDVVTRWFGEWDEVNGSAWQSAIIGKSTVADALKKSTVAWNDMRK